MTESVETTETTEQATEQPQIVEWDDFNNANLTEYEVTYTNGGFEFVKAHFVHYPTRDSFGLGTRRDNGHIQFTGYYDGKHKTALVVLADDVKSVRNLSLVSPSHLFFPPTETAHEGCCASGDDSADTSDADKTSSL